MQLSVLQTKARLLLGNISTADFSDSNLNRALNDYYNQFIVKAILSSGEWRVSGEIATTNLVAAQAEYLFPTGLVTIERMEINPTGATNGWSRVIVVDDLEIKDAISNTSGDTIGANTVVYLHNGSFFFKDVPATSVTDGIKIWYSKEPAELSSSTDEPILPEGLHMGIVWGACLDYSISRKLNDQVQIYKRLVDEKMEETKLYYANRTKIRKPRLQPRFDTYA